MMRHFGVGAELEKQLGSSTRCTLQVEVGCRQSRHSTAHPARAARAPHQQVDQHRAQDEGSSQRHQHQPDGGRLAIVGPLPGKREVAKAGKLSEHTKLEASAILSHDTTQMCSLRVVRRACTAVATHTCSVRLQPRHPSPACLQSAVPFTACG